MQKTILVILAIVILPISLEAKSPTYFKFGANLSYLRHTEGKNKPGICLEIDKYFFPIRAFNGFVGVGLGYTIKRLKLENKTWPSGMEPEWSDVSIGDIPLDRSYFDFAAKVGCSFSLFRNKALVELFSGASLSFPIKYLSYFADSTIFLSPDERGKYKFDYLRCESEGADKYVNWILGIALIYKDFGIEMRYDRAASAQECIRGLNINDALDSFRLLLRYCL